ncbi:MAG: glycosyltransferase family 4 protein [Bacteroidetes bacterium]|nr:glycosyltransferase family 4 protein [Bacteroidota bacterium]
MAEVGRLRVVFDAHAMTPHRSGIGEYSQHLLHAMVRDCSDRIDLHLYVPSGIHPVVEEDDISRLTADVRDGDLYSPWHQWRLPALLRSGQYDLLHCPDFLIPAFSPLPTICTIHDIIPLVHPEFIPRSLKVRLLPLFRAWARRAVRRSAAVITDSEHSKSDIVRLLDVDTRRVRVIPLAPTLEPCPGEAAALPGGLSPGAYFLYVGRHDPYKGLAHLLRAFAEARRGGLPDPLHVAVAGKRDDRYGYEELVMKLGIDARVHFLGYVTSAQLSTLYAHALAYVHPSLYEGFGLPPLDAMRHGTPVISSDRSSLPEVVGDAAMMVNPEHTEEFARMLRDVAENTTLRTQFIQKGFEHVTRFSWNLTALKTVEEYVRVPDARPRSI